jgi:hypothetical protein
LAGDNDTTAATRKTEACFLLMHGPLAAGVVVRATDSARGALDLE